MAIAAGNSFGTRDKLNVGAQSFDIHRLELLEKKIPCHLAKLPFSLRILLENLLRCEDGRFVHPDDIRALANWTPGAAEKEIAFMPARILLQDFTGVWNISRAWFARCPREAELRRIPIPLSARIRTRRW